MAGRPSRKVVGWGRSCGRDAVEGAIGRGYRHHGGRHRVHRHWRQGQAVRVASGGGGHTGSGVRPLDFPASSLPISVPLPLFAPLQPWQEEM